jgi:uncharacterized protein YpiB (UPF0302 family)
MIGIYTRQFKFERDLDNPAVAATHPTFTKAAELPPDLQTQYEALLHTVWDAERRERMMDRIDAALDAEERRQHQDKSALRGAGVKDRLRSRD